MSLLYLQGLPASFTKINPEGVTECPEREIESYWSTRIATQITPELPLSSYSNCMAMSVVKFARTGTLIYRSQGLHYQVSFATGRRNPDG